MNFVVYKSSAGSGKTSALVKEYLSVVLKNPEDFRRILAITFTNKAADEMKERVLSYLKKLSAADYDTKDELFPVLVEKTGLGRDIIMERAEKVLNLILHNYSDFAVGTIDSFVYRIIRIFTYDLNIPVNFEVELDKDELIDKAVNLLIDNVGFDKDLTKVLVDFTETKADEESNWDIEKDLKNITNLLFKEDGQVYIEKVKQLSIDDFLEIKNRIFKIIKSFESRISKYASEAYALIRDNNIPDDVFFHGNSGICKYFERLAIGEFEKIIPNTFVKKTVEDDKWYSGKADESYKNAIDAIKSRLIEFYNLIRECIEKQYKHYVLMTLIGKNIYPVAVLNEIQKMLDRLKTEDSIIHISEFNKRIAEIVMNEPVPFIYERLGERYKHFLIDEFQDTSVLQWHNLLPLVENSLAEGYFNMVVGDGKQAIYRWRSGEVEQFENLPEIMDAEGNQILEERQESIKRNHEERKLNINFRSKAEIVEFNNDFFREASKNLSPDYQGIYKDVKQELKNDNRGGLISIEFYDKSSSEGTFEDFNFKGTLKIVKELIEDGFSFKDIAVLCRTNNKASRIAKHLIENDVEVVSSESLLLSNSQVVNFTYAVMRYVYNPDDNIVKTEIINYLLKTGRIISTGLNEDLQEVMKRKDAFGSFMNRHGYNIPAAYMVNLPLYDLCEKIIRIFCLNVPANPYIQFFLDEIHAYSMKNGNNIVDFIEWWDMRRNKSSIVVSEEINAVRVMTIHKAKGLEFPVVIYAFADEEEKESKKYLWVNLSDKELSNMDIALLPMKKKLQETDFADVYRKEMEKSRLDMINLLYVVMTRPSERLYVLTELPVSESRKLDVPSFFADFLKNTGKWEKEKLKYEYGTAVKHAATEKSRDIKYDLKSFVSTDWRDRLIQKSFSSDMWDIENSEKSRQWGKTVHYALSMIGNIENIEPVVEKMFLHGFIDVTEKQELSEKLNVLLLNPKIEPYFKKGLNVKTEHEILTADGNILRPDRVVIYDNKKAAVIDFKTGKPEDYHIKQINQYSGLLSEMGYTVSASLLVYVDENKVVEVDL